MLETALAERLLDNSPALDGLYIAHIAIPCRSLDEAAEWYSEVLGAQPIRILKDRVTFSFGGVLQLVCHLEPGDVEQSPRAYPRHFGLTFLRMEDFERMLEHVESLGVDFIMRPSARFRASPHEHRCFMIADPSGNVVEFKCYNRPENSY